jgi:spermidine synthase
MNYKVAIKVIFAIAMQSAHKKLKNIFPVAKVYQAHIPTYGSGHWLFGFASKKYDPVTDLNEDLWNSLGIMFIFPQ